jgi:hypothetical protein
LNILALLSDHEDLLIKSLCSITLYAHSEALFNVLENNSELSEYLLDKLIDFIKNNNWMIRVSTMFLFTKLMLYDKINIKKEYCSIFFREVLFNFNNNGEYLTKGFTLEMLSMLLRNKKYVDEVSKIIEKVGLNNIMKECHLCYYNGLYVACELNKHEYFSAKCSPHFRDDFLEEFNSLTYDEYISLINSIIVSVKRKVWLGGWIDRYYAGKYLGNLIYVKPHHANKMIDIIYQLLDDDNYIVRGTGIWILRLITEMGIPLPKDIISKSIDSCYDWHCGNRFEYALFYYTLIKKFPDIIVKDKLLLQKFISVIVTKYITDENPYVRHICITSLKIIKLDESNELWDLIRLFKNYHKLSIYKRINLLENAWKMLNQRKPIVMFIKSILKHNIEHKEYDTIESVLLRFVNITDEELMYIIPELVLLRGKSEAAERILHNLKQKYPELPHDLEKSGFQNINEHISTIRMKKLEELLIYVNEGYLISHDLLDKLKEMIIYEDCKINVDVIIEILKNMGNEPESNKIIEETSELMEYLKENLIHPNVSNIKDLKYRDWKEIYVKLSNTLIGGLSNVFKNDSIEDIIDSFMYMLNNKDCVILKIRIIDILLERIYINDELLKKLSCHKNTFPTLLSLYLRKGYHLLSKKALILLEELSLSNSYWMKNNLIEYFKNNPSNFEKILLIMSENISANVMIEISGFIEYVFKNEMAVCRLDDAEYIVKILEKINNNYPWFLFKKTVDVILSCQCIKTNRKLVKKVAKKLIDYAKNSKDKTNKEYISIYMKKLLGVQNINIEELDEEAIEYILDLNDMKNKSALMNN